MLRVLDSSQGRQPPAYLAGAAPVGFGPGFYEEERNEEGAFRWMGEAARLDFAPAAEERWLELAVYTELHDLSQHLDAAAVGTISAAVEPARIELCHGWNRLSLGVPPGCAGVELTASRLYPPACYPSDRRRLSVRLQPARLHADPERHRHLARAHANAVANLRETLAGRTVLDSTPPTLGIDMHGVCNVKPPCVYCEWDTSKEAEGANVDRPFGAETLAEWGSLFDDARHLVNCSIGEPFMMKDFDRLLDVFGDRGKSLEMTTNGQILTERNVSRLLGRSIELYVSLDAATPGTYAKLRNDRFDRILVNLRRLIAAKGGRVGLPRVYLVFMPMRVNVGELEDFVRLCAELGVDRMILRPLNDSQSIDLDWERGGHRFVYHQELLPFDELIEASGRARGWCERYGVPFADQLDFGEAMRSLFAERFDSAYRAALAGAGEATPSGASAAAAVAAAPPPPPAPAADATPAGPRPSLGAERLPLCHEPWKSLYVLRRGIYPCCYGGQPIAGMDDHAAAWNGPAIQEIRRELAAGRFARYCLESPACPIVRKAAAGDPRRPPVPVGRLRRVWRHLDRALGGVPGRLLAPVKPLLRPLLAPRGMPGPIARPAPE
jgi:MoaA/NifB/PqqE/SkfB family radical SAM enzyme